LVPEQTANTVKSRAPAAPISDGGGISVSLIALLNALDVCGNLHSPQPIAALLAGQHRNMACSQFEYVKQYETDDRLLPGCWIVLRLDGKGFTKCAAARRSPLAVTAHPVS
jgi:hypothetical protein